MVAKLSITEARQNLPHIIHNAESGQVTEITRYGEGVAVVVSLARWRKLHQKKKSFFKSLKNLRLELETDGNFISEGELGSLREKSPGRDFEW